MSDYEDDKLILKLTLLLLLILCAIMLLATFAKASPINKSCYLLSGSGNSDVKIVVFGNFDGSVMSKTRKEIFAKRVVNELKRESFYKTLTYDLYIESLFNMCNSQLSYNQHFIEVGFHKDWAIARAAPGSSDSAGLLLFTSKWKWNDLGILYHEFGHTLGLDHTNDDTWMGSRESKSFNIQQRAAMLSFLGK